jgi:hypothetical protein
MEEGFPGDLGEVVGIEQAAVTLGERSSDLIGQREMGHGDGIAAAALLSGEGCHGCCRPGAGCGVLHRQPCRDELSCWSGAAEKPPAAWGATEGRRRRGLG